MARWIDVDINSLALHPPHTHDAPALSSEHETPSNKPAQVQLFWPPKN